jgi:hypothetical protein
MRSRSDLEQRLYYNAQITYLHYVWIVNMLVAPANLYQLQSHHPEPLPVTSTQRRTLTPRYITPY